MRFSVEDLNKVPRWNPPSFPVPNTIKVGQVFSFRAEHARKDRDGNLPVLFPVVVVWVYPDNYGVRYCPIHNEKCTAATEDFALSSTDGVFSNFVVACWAIRDVSLQSLDRYYGDLSEESTSEIISLSRGGYVSEKNRDQVGTTIVHSTDFRMDWRDWFIRNLNSYPQFDIND